MCLILHPTPNPSPLKLQAVQKFLMRHLGNNDVWQSRDRGTSRDSQITAGIDYKSSQARLARHVLTYA